MVQINIFLAPQVRFLNGLSEFSKRSEDEAEAEERLKRETHVKDLEQMIQNSTKFYEKYLMVSL